MWSLSTLGFAHAPLIDAIASASLRSLDEWAPRSLANIAWSFATLGCDDKLLINAIAAAALRRIQSKAASSRSEDVLLKELVINLKSLAWACHFAGFLTEELDTEIGLQLVRMARERDRLIRERLQRHPTLQPPALPPRRKFIAEGADPDVLPEIVADFAEFCVVHKPPGWEADCEDVGTGIPLSTFLQLRFNPAEAPLVHFEEHQFGMVHRLDRVSSGLLLVGKTFEGFHSLQWQLNTGRLDREYMVVVHGWVPPTLRLIDARVLHIHAEGHRESTVTEQGKPSQTRLTTVGHCTLLGHEEEQLSIVVIQICTGRRHQIRAHLCHVGHPSVADGKYMHREQFVRDRQWCARNFLHRYRLGFQDCDGQKHDARAPLPRDLLEAVSHLEPVCAQSAAALSEWASGRLPQPWATYGGLPGSADV